MNDFFKLPVALTEALSKNDMMLVVGGDRAVKITVVNEGHGCNVAGALIAMHYQEVVSVLQNV